jgi:hypothetical protein
LAALLLWAGGSACFDGPSFLKQEGSALLSDPQGAVVILPTREEEGAATATLVPSEEKTQVVKASANSQIAGSLAAFPPGAVAVTTEITIAPGETIATEETVSELDLATGLASAAPAVAVTSSVPTDAVVPFTVAIPIPDESALALADPYANLIVLYEIAKAGEGASYKGIITRDRIEIEDGYVRFVTSHFGTYQAVITKEPVVVAVEVPSDPQPVDPVDEEPVTARGGLRFARGFLTTTFGDDTQSQDGLRAWMLRVSPAEVGQEGRLRGGHVGRTVTEE